VATLRVIELPESIWDTEIGDMWRVPDRDLPERECWCVHCPGDVFWFTTDRAYDANNPTWSVTGLLWEVSGVPPNISVSPSIDAGERWNGEFT